MAETRRRGAETWAAADDRWQFFAFFTAGAFFILALKELIDSQILVTAVPCGLMLAYAGLLWNFEEKRPRSASAGDNLYYLGFLYTLTSLAHSLFRFSTQEQETEIIITNFGIAISTTILGMALRILLGQPGTDEPSAIESSARLDLAQSARLLRQQMDYTVTEFEDFRTRARENLERGFDDAQAGVSETLERAASLSRAVEEFEKAAQKVSHATAGHAEALQSSAEKLAAFGSTVTRLDSSAGSAVQAIDTHSTRLTADTAVVADSLQQQAQRVQAVDFRQAFVDNVTKPAAAELRSVAIEIRAGLAGNERALAGNEKAMNGLNEALKESRRLAQTTTDAITASRNLTASIEAAGSRISGFSDGAREAAREVAQVRDGFSETALRLRAVNEDLTQASGALAALSRRLEEARRVEPRRRGLFDWFRRGRRQTASSLLDAGGND